MLRHHHNAGTSMIEEKTIQRRHSHHHIHLNLKPTAVIDHFKTRARRKRLSKKDPSISIHSAPDQNINNNNNKQLNLYPTEFIHEIPIRSLNKQSFLEPDIEVIDENHASIEIDEQDSVVPNADEDSSWQTNQKMTRSKPKPLKATVSLPEPSNQSNVKKRRQTFRRTGFQLRDNDFRSIFSELPSDEQLIIAFPCAWRKDVFMHGRMFLSVNYICYYTCFFKWEESICIAFKDIVSVTREKAVKVVPNAIKLRTKNDEQYLFASYVPREKIFLAIFRLWQNALLDQPLDYQQVRTLVLADQLGHDESTGDSEESVMLENTGEFESGLYSRSLPVTSNGSIETPIRSVGSNPRAVPSDNETTTYQSTCPCESHLARTYADRLFTFNVDTLFELICGDNSFTRSFHDSQKLTDYVHGEWHLNNETGKRERQVTYKTITQSMLGTNHISCREKQTLETDQPHSMYVLNCEVYNEGMRYTDAFYVATRFCMVQRDSEHSLLKVTGEIRYIKNVSGFIKSFIEKNAHSSIEGGVNEQIRRLEIQSNKSDQRPPSILKKHRKKTIVQNQTEEESSINSIDLSVPKRSITGHGILYDIILLVGIFLIILHVYLCYKLYAIDQVYFSPDAVCLKQCKEECLQNRT